MYIVHRFRLSVTPSNVVEDVSKTLTKQFHNRRSIFQSFDKFNQLHSDDWMLVQELS